MAAKGWSREFDDPIILPCGGQLQTLRDAGKLCLRHELVASAFQSSLALASMVDKERTVRLAAGERSHDGLADLARRF